MNSVIKFVGTFAYTGFFPLAPATFASAVFAALYFLVPGGEVLAHPVVCAVTLVVSVPVSSRLEKIYGEDPSCVVIDEVVGMQVILVGTDNVGVWGILAAFFLFRVFDVVKPYPVNRSQRLPSGYGVVVDDLLAGLYARLVLVVISLLVPGLGSFVL